MKLADPAWLAAKAGVASTMAVIGARALGVDDALSAGFVALACVSPSAYAGVKNGLAQLGGSALACALTGLPIVVWPALRGSPPAVLATLVASVYACFRLRIASAYLVAGFSALYLHLLPFASTTSGISVRIEAVGIGLVAATLVNTVVSGLFSERVAARRISVAKAIVSRELDAAATWLEKAAVTEPPDFEDSFAVVRELRADLGAASHERLFPGASRARASAERGLGLASALEETAHLAKEMLSLCRDDDGQRRAAALEVRAAAEHLAGRAGTTARPAIDSTDDSLAPLAARLRASAERAYRD